MNGFYIVLEQIIPVLYWAFVLLLAVASLCLSVLALRMPRRIFVYTASGTLAAAIALVAIPSPGTIPLVHILLGFLALAISALGGAPAVLLTFAIATHGGMREGPRGGMVVGDAKPGNDGSEVLRGGMTIGVFERFASTAAIMAGFAPAVAVIVAIKSVGRFTELNEAAARERFIIGTLVSLVWAGACAALFVLS